MALREKFRNREKERERIMSTQEFCRRLMSPQIILRP